jgi:hypothetical protein
MMSLFTNGYDDLVTKLETITGLRVVDDPRNINPPCALVQPPSITMHTNVIAELSFQVTLIGFGPGQYQAMTKLLDLADLIRAEEIGLTSAVPALQQIAGQDYPAYQLTINTKLAP